MNIDLLGFYDLALFRDDILNINLMKLFTRKCVLLITHHFFQIDIKVDQTVQK